MQIFPAGPAHARALVELAAATFPLACPADEPQGDIDAHVAGELNAARFVARLADPDQTVLVARDGGGMHGYEVLVRPEPDDDFAPLLSHSTPPS